MVYKYKRKTTHQSWELSQMEAALARYKEGGISMTNAALDYGVPSATLQRWLKKPQATTKTLGRFRSVFTPQQESLLVDHILQMEERLFGLTIHDLKSLAYQFATRNGIPHSFNNEQKIAGKGWVAGFWKRHRELSVRLLEKTSAARPSAFNVHNVNAFFDNLDKLYAAHNYPASRIYNVDEAGIMTAPNKLSKIISKKGKKPVGALSSAERETLITAEICFNAAGGYVPPALVFPMVRHFNTFGTGLPPDAKVFAHPSGWMQTHIFTEWFQHFLKFSKPTADDRVLLIFDGHATHVKNIELLEMAKENFVDIIVLPPHCPHRLQPLDVSFMLPLSANYEQEVRIWLREHPGKIVTVKDAGGLFGRAYLKAANMETAINGFKKTGIFPFNRIFSSFELAAAETTDRYPSQCEASDRPISKIPPSPTATSPQIDVKDILISPGEILPIPHVEAEEGEVQKGTGRRGSTVIASSTSFIVELKRLQNSKRKPTERQDEVKAKKVRNQLFAADEETENDHEVSLCGDTDSGLEINEPDLIPLVLLRDIQVGTWIAVNYEGNLYPGKVLSKEECGVSVNCMEKINKNFRWPQKPDVWTYKAASYQVLKEPKQLKGGFFCVPELCAYTA